MNRSIREFLWVLIAAFTSLILAFSVAWLILAQVQFLYGTWHDVGGIAEGIEQYGPKNHYKQGFADTTREQRIELFSLINTSIHNHGYGLEAIQYKSPTSNGLQQLLREPEVVHLQDVANLIDFMVWVAALNALLWLVLVVYAFKKNRQWFGLKRQLIPMCGAFAVLVFVLLLFGPEAVFNQLHIWVFPGGHQWFFYYQESLMSTMMLAPVLFAWIGVAWALLSVGLFVLIVHLVHSLQTRIVRYEQFGIRE